MILLWTVTSYLLAQNAKECWFFFRKNQARKSWVKQKLKKIDLLKTCPKKGYLFYVKKIGWKSLIWNNKTDETLSVAIFKRWIKYKIRIYYCDFNFTVFSIEESSVYGPPLIWLLDIAVISTAVDDIGSLRPNCLHAHSSYLDKKT